MQRPEGKIPNAEKAVKLKIFLEDYGEKKGYDRTGFYQQMLKRFRQLENDGDTLKETLGVQRSGGLWVGFKNKLALWLDKTIQPGPSYQVQPVPEDLDSETFLEQVKGVYHLKDVLKKLDPQIVTYWKVTGAVKRAEDPKKTVGAFLKNGVYVVDMEYFVPWYWKNEP